MSNWFQFLSVASSLFILTPFAEAESLKPLASSVPVDPAVEIISFNSAEGPGAPIVLYGGSLVEDTGEPIPPPEEWPNTDDRADFDFANLTSGGAVLYASSDETESTFQMLDADPDTFHEFDESSEGAFFVVALAEMYPIYRASLSTMNPIKRVDVWAFNEDPQEFFSSESSQSDSNAGSGGFLSQRAPTSQFEVPDGEDVTTIVMSLPETTARYLLVRVTGKESGEPVRVSLFSVYGEVPREYLVNRNRSNRASLDYGLDPIIDSAPQIPVASP